MPASFYPEIRYGDDVMFATDPNVNQFQWRYGKVSQPKNNSCDILVFGQRGWEWRHDCLHIDDPLCDSTRIWAEQGRGVFKLCPHEEERRKDRERLIALDKKFAALERLLDKQALQETKPRGRPRGRPAKIRVPLEPIVVEQEETWQTQ